MSRPVRLLIVDDEDAIIRMLTQFLTSRGYLVCWADRPPKCLAALDDFTDVRIVLLDFSAGAPRLLRQIKQKRPDVEVILMTGQGDEKLARQSISLGAFAYLAKPLDLSILEKLVEACIKRNHE